MASPASLDAHIAAQIQGEIRGQVAVGNHIVQIGSVHGGVVNVLTQGQQPQPRLRPLPVLLRPRPFPGLLDRKPETEVALSALRSATPVELHGPEGIGKTALLRHLAHHAAVAAFPDGVVYLSARHQALEDLEQSLYDAFYECDVPFKPTEAQLRHALGARQALIVLDDVGLAREEVEALMGVAPGCAFLLASTQRRLWGEGRSLALRGLPPDDALALLERELGRPLAAEEREQAAAICALLEGHPLRVLQAAALAREEGLSLAQVRERLTARAPSQALADQALEALPEPERRILAVLAALDGAPLSADHLAALAGLADAQAALERLQHFGLVQAHSPRYSLTGTLAEEVRRWWDVGRWAERALVHFVAWAERHRTAPDRLLAEAEPILVALRWGVAAGRWADVLRLGRAVEEALALGRRWGAWEQVLRWILQAARRQRDRAAEAWALHQLGTRALCLGHVEEARRLLAQALRLRQALGDHVGAAITRHNLDVLLSPPPPPSPPSEPTPAPTGGGFPLFAKALVALLLLAVVGAGMWWRFGRAEQETPPVVAVATTTPTPTPSTTPSPTMSPTPTATATATATPTPTPTVTPVPSVRVRLAEGCDRPYPAGYQTEVIVVANASGQVRLWADGRLEREFPTEPGVTSAFSWVIGDQAGSHELVVELIQGHRTVARAACAYSVSLPDLAVRTFDLAGPPERDPQWNVTVPVVVEVVNQGNAPADIFKVAARYQDEQGSWLAPFAPPDQPEAWYAFTPKPLPPGESAVFKGTITLPNLAQKEVRLEVIADSCAGEEAMPAHCRVKETDEENNRASLFVKLPAPQVLFDFVEGAAQARWWSNAGALDFPGAPLDKRGAAYWVEGSCLEDGSCPSRALVTHPTWTDGGYIYGEFCATGNIVLGEGDRFFARVGFLRGAEAGDVTFRISFGTYRFGGEFPTFEPLDALVDTHDGQVRTWVIPLDELAGQQGCFALEVQARQSPSQAVAVWVEARLERP